MTPAEADLLEVRLLGVPVALHEAAQAQLDGLLREFRLLLERPGDDGVDVELPERLLRVVRDRAEAYPAADDVRDAQLERAVLEGVERVDAVRFAVPRGVALASGQLQALLVAADVYCRAGRELVTLAAPPEVARYRAWYLGQLEHQARGGAATAWPG